MEKQQVLNELNPIFRELFKNPGIVVGESTNSSDIDEWDSLNHAQLISMVEKHFKIRFKLTEMMNFKNVGKMCDTIVQKTSAV
jgi:acyl carrier protein